MEAFKKSHPIMEETPVAGTMDPGDVEKNAAAFMLCAGKVSEVPSWKREHYADGKSVSREEEPLE